MRRAASVLSLIVATGIAVAPIPEAGAARNGRFILFSGYDENNSYHVFRIKVDGTGRRKLSDRHGSDAPAWSSDGRRIAYASSRGIIVARSDGSNKRVVVKVGNEPQWSPDDRRMLFTRACCVEDPRYSAVFIVRSDGRRMRRIAYADAFQRVGAAQWSPGGRRISYMRSRWRDSIFVVNRWGKERRRLVRRDDIQSYDWSPDGSRIVFSCLCGREQNDLYMVNVSTGVVVRITRTAGFEYDPEWSPTGGKIVTVQWRADATGWAKLITIHPTGLLKDIVAARLRGNPSPSWSPNGRRIVFLRGEWSEIYVIDADGSDVRQLTDDRKEEVNPTWQPR